MAVPFVVVVKFTLAGPVVLPERTIVIAACASEKMPGGGGLPSALKDVPSVRLNFRYEPDVPAPETTDKNGIEERNAAVQADFDQTRVEELIDRTITSPDGKRVAVVYHRTTDLPSEFRLDMYTADGKVLKKMLKDSIAASKKAAKKHLVTVEWSPLLHITPRPFDETLMKFARQSVKEVTGSAPELPSGPLHDAAEMAAVVPTAMVVAQSSPGISHTRLEDTPLPALEKSIRAFLLTVDKTVAHFG